jgi:hypothetical protein
LEAERLLEELGSHSKGFKAFLDKPEFFVCKSLDWYPLILDP